MSKLEYEKHLEKLKFIDIYLHKDSIYEKSRQEEINDLEKDKNITLPSDYKHFILKYSRIFMNTIEAEDGSHSNFGFSLGKNYSGKDFFYEMLELITGLGDAEYDTGNKNWLYLGRTYIDNPIYISIEKNTFGYIYMVLEESAHFYEEDDFVEVPVDYNYENQKIDDYSIKYHLVAKGFTEFILMLEDRDGCGIY